MMDPLKLQPIIRIVDDEPSVRSSEAFLVSMCGFQCTEFESAAQFLENDDAIYPGCVILDIRMPEMTGLQLQDEMIKRGNDLSIIFLTGHGDVDMAVKALLTGATDFLTKPPEPEKLKEALNKAVSLNIKNRKKAFIRNEAQKKFDTLTASEKLIAPLIAKGTLSKVIAFERGVSDQAIKNARNSIFHKLDVKHVVELNDFLRLCGYIGAEDD